MNKIGYSIGACVAGALAVLFLVLSILTLFTGNVDGLFVKEPITASASSLDASGERSLVQLRGILFNEGDERLTVEKVRLTLRHENATEKRELDGFVIEARTAYDVFYEWSSPVPFDSVDAVELVIDGEATRLSNSEQSPLSLETLIFLSCAVVAVIFAVFFGKKRYYVYQEEKMCAE
ncbi:MAG: hypothetical protein E7643_04515 [Ruminococcaceae bacterium]|nr:hypothetical protein [Oscillospiraceae bacterium]